jgi:hypothetical protein
MVIFPQKVEKILNFIIKDIEILMDISMATAPLAMG